MSQSCSSCPPAYGRREPQSGLSFSRSQRPQRTLTSVAREANQHSLKLPFVHGLGRRPSFGDEAVVPDDVSHRQLTWRSGLRLVASFGVAAPTSPRQRSQPVIFCKVGVTAEHLRRLKPGLAAVLGVIDHRRCSRGHPDFPQEVRFSTARRMRIIFYIAEPAEGRVKILPPAIARPTFAVLPFRWNTAALGGSEISLGGGST